MALDTNRILEMLKSLDTLATVEAQLTAEIAKSGAAWALERFAADVFYARAMARIVRPLIEAHDDVTTEEWIAGIRHERNEATRQLVDGCWRSNSTSVLQNAINQWEAHAIGKFVDYTRYWALDA